VVFAESFAIVIFIAKDEVLEIRNAGQGGGARNVVRSVGHNHEALQGVSLPSSTPPLASRARSDGRDRLQPASIRLPIGMRDLKRPLENDDERWRR
jgi:hypothetical protein